MGTYNWDSDKGEYVYTPAVHPSGDINLSPVVSAIETQGGYTRAQLADLLGSNGSSWVYDCRLSLSQLYDLATSSGLIVTLPFNSQLDQINSSVESVVNTIISKDFSPEINVSPNITVSPPEVNVSVSPPEVNVTVEPAEVNVDTSKLATQKTLNDLYTRNHTDVNNVRNLLNNTMLPVFNQIGTVLNTWNTGNNLGILPQPDLGDEDPNDNLPSSVQAAYSDGGVASDSSVSQVFGQMVDWGDNGAPTMIVPDFISGFLSAFIGSIPSVGSDPVMFTFDCEIPFLGHIQHTFSWADFPYVSDFRALLVWLVYLFFGLACFKLLHKTLI